MSCFVALISSWVVVSFPGSSAPECEHTTTTWYHFSREHDVIRKGYSDLKGNCSCNYMLNPRWVGYHVAGNFRERKRSWIGEKYNFRKDNFCGLLTFAAPKDTTLPNFMEKTSTKPQNSRKFSPSNVSHYTVYVVSHPLPAQLSSLYPWCCSREKKYQALPTHLHDFNVRSPEQENLHLSGNIKTLNGGRGREGGLTIVRPL